VGVGPGTVPDSLAREAGHEPQAERIDRLDRARRHQDLATDEPARRVDDEIPNGPGEVLEVHVVDPSDVADAS
jgi:hypothetical protein